MWRVISIYNLEEKHDINSLYLNSTGGSYLITFYSTISKIPEEMIIKFNSGLWICSVASKLRKFNYYPELVDFICKRYNWNSEYIGGSLHVVSK